MQITKSNFFFINLFMSPYKVFFKFSKGRQKLQNVNEAIPLVELFVDAHGATSIVLAAFGELRSQRARAFVVVAIASNIDKSNAWCLFQRAIRGSAALDVVEHGHTHVDVHQQHEHDDPMTWTIHSIASGHVYYRSS